MIACVFPGNMEGPEVTFIFQFGIIRDMVTVPVSTINLKSLKELACDFINSKVSMSKYLCNNIKSKMPTENAKMPIRMRTNANRQESYEENLNG